MIDKPEVGQRVCRWKDDYSGLLWGTIVTWDDTGICVKDESGRYAGESYWHFRSEAYATSSESAAALRAEGQRLIEAAERLERETDHA